jgi:hypothetical protein
MKYLVVLIPLVAVAGYFVRADQVKKQRAAQNLNDIVLGLIKDLGNNTRSFGERTRRALKEKDVISIEKVKSGSGLFTSELGRIKVTLTGQPMPADEKSRAFHAAAVAYFESCSAIAKHMDDVYAVLTSGKSDRDKADEIETMFQIEERRDKNNLEPLQEAQREMAHSMGLEVSKQ